MRSLTLKLSLAFLAVALTVAGLAAVFARNALVREFDRLVVQQAEENFIADITTYYETFGSWDGANAWFRPQNAPANRQQSGQRPPADAPPPPRQTQPRTLPPPFFLADQDGDTIKELILLVGSDEDENALIYIKGKINMKDVAKIGSHMGIDEDEGKINIPGL